MVGPDRLDEVALTALLGPLRFELVDGLASVAQELLHVFGDAFEAVVLYVFDLPVLLDGLHRFFPGLALLDLFSQALYFLPRSGFIFTLRSYGLPGLIIIAKKWLYTML